MVMGRYAAAFAWPFRPSNLPPLVMGGAIAVLVPGFLMLLPLPVVLLGAWPLILAVAGYYALFLREVLEGAMAGRDELPAWPDFDGVYAQARDFFSVMAPLVAAFLPTAVLVFLTSEVEIGWWNPVPPFERVIAGPLMRSAASPAWVPPALGALWLAGWLAFPILVLAWPFFGIGALFHPVLLVRSAVRSGGEYFVAALLTAALVLGAWGVTRIPVPSRLEWFETFRPFGVAFLALVVAARVLGTFYHAKRSALGWERESRPLPEPRSAGPADGADPGIAQSG
jgi:hypothetical protein